ncbi:MAG: hypothetical protein ACKOUM_09120 [Sphingopyxis sp.]
MVMKQRKIVSLMLASTLFAGASAHAQNSSLTAHSGEVTLRAGFQPDPHGVSVTAGGSIDAATLGNQCRGMISDAPDYQVSYTAGSLPLTFQTQSDTDTTLIVNANDGSWHCDDDSGEGTNAQVTFQHPGSGTYDVWVGTYGGGTSPAMLWVTERSGGGNAAASSGGGAPDTSATPNFGSITLPGGFAPDPHTVSVRSGGSIDASTVSSGCRGTISTAPDYEVTYNGSGSLPLIFRSMSSSDTTLVINGPDGRWYCDDDSAGNLNPEVVFNSGMAGVYDIWVGAFSGDGASAVLEVSELRNRLPSRSK